MSETINCVPLSELGLPRGVKLWEIDLATLLITEARVLDVKASDGHYIKAVAYKNGCRYAAAINATNADRKFVRMLKK